MPPFVNRVQLQQAVNTTAVPILEAVAANDNLRSLHRFDGDDPPPYVSSTESSDHEDVDLIPRACHGPMPEELRAIMDRPISDDELAEIAGFMHEVIRPENTYYLEAKREYDRVDDYRPGPRPQMFQRLNGARRKGVIARHLVRRRWEKLGIWNPDWGFAGRKVQDGDDFARWTWWWEPDGAVDEHTDKYRIGCELVARTLRLRQNLRRGEHVPAVPRSQLRPDATTSEAEAFLISRPWFIFRLEVAEERTRYFRLSNEDRDRYPHNARDQVTKWWKERGDWRDEFNTRNPATPWKWRHESPSPEPEDLSPLLNMDDSPLDAVEEMEFTPSEVDELETIALPRSEQPKGFWVIKQNDCPPFFPGMMEDRGGTPDVPPEVFPPQRLSLFDPNHPWPGLSQPQIDTAAGDGAKTHETDEGNDADAEDEADAAKEPEGDEKAEIPAALSNTINHACVSANPDNAGPETEIKNRFRKIQRSRNTQ